VEEDGGPGSGSEQERDQETRWRDVPHF
jgi:hypothetical protein